MNSHKKNQNKMRFCAFLVWKRLFLKKENFNEILIKEKTFISLNQKDKSFVYFIINIILRNSQKIEFYYKRFLKKQIKNNLIDLSGILTLGTAEIFWSKTPNYAIVNSYVDLVKKKFGSKNAGFVNAIFQNISRNKEELSKLSWDVKDNFPKNLLIDWENNYGKKLTLQIIKIFLLEPYLDLICSKKMSVKSKKVLIDSLIGKEIYPNVIRSNYKGKIEAINGFISGEWWIQDIGSYIHMEILTKKIHNDYKPQSVKNLSFYDMCAAPGGKTLQLLDNGFKVTCNDINKKRLQKMSDNLQRLKFNSELYCDDALKLKFNIKFDVIIIDAPCSATGTIRKNPDILIRDIQNGKKLIDLQNKLLNKASSQLKDNGYIMYIVCSLEKKEGEDVINLFLKKNKNFIVLPITPYDCSLLDDNQITKEGFLRLLPNVVNIGEICQLNGNNGFFSAILKKI